MWYPNILTSKSGKLSFTWVSWLFHLVRVARAVGGLIMNGIVIIGHLAFPLPFTFYFFQSVFDILSLCVFLLSFFYFFLCPPCPHVARCCQLRALSPANSIHWRFFTPYFRLFVVIGIGHHVCSPVKKQQGTNEKEETQTPEQLAQCEWAGSDRGSGPCKLNWKWFTNACFFH